MLRHGRCRINVFLECWHLLDCRHNIKNRYKNCQGHSQVPLNLVDNGVTVSITAARTVGIPTQ